MALKQDGLQLGSPLSNFCVFRTSTVLQLLLQLTLFTLLLLCVITMAAQISFEDLLKNICYLNNNEFVWLGNAGVNSLTTLCDNTEKELADTVEQIRKEKYTRNPARPAQLSYKVFRFEQERNLKVLLSEVRIRYETGRDIEELCNADVTVHHLKVWKARCMQRAGFKDPPSDSRPTAAAIAKDWVQGFVILDEWIRGHVDNSYKIPLSFMIRPDPRPAFVQQPCASLANKYTQSCPRTVLVGTEEGLTLQTRSSGTFCSPSSVVITCMGISNSSAQSRMVLQHTML
jgi:hypothetical protein